jgi:hypothetical protein
VLRTIVTWLATIALFLISVLLAARLLIGRARKASQRRGDPDGGES